MAHTAQDMMHAIRRESAQIVFRNLGPVDCVVSLNKAVIRIRPRELDAAASKGGPGGGGGGAQQGLSSRLLDSIVAARRQYPCLVLLLQQEEGKHALEGHLRERQQAIQARFVRDIISMQGVELLWADSSREAAQVVLQLAQASPNRLPPDMQWLPDASPAVQVLFQVPHWSYVTVCAVLTKLGSLQAVLNATRGQLEAVSGLASSQIEQLQRFAAVSFQAPASG